MPKPFLSVIIPAYNEAERLPLTLADIDAKLSLSEYSSEVIVVDDGSTDATVTVAKRFAGLMKNLRVIENKENHGKGWVVRQGMLAAKGNWRLFTDADNSTSIDQFEQMRPFLREYQVVIGSRAVRGAVLDPPEPFYRRIMGKLGNLYIQVLLLPHVWDTQCGFKCFSEEAALRIFQLARVDRWAFDVEALALAKRLGYVVKEVPVHWVDQPGSTVRLSAYPKFLIEVARLWLRFRKGEYGTA